MDPYILKSMFGNYESISPLIHQENQRHNFEELNWQTTPLLCRQVNVDASSAQYGLSGIALNLMKFWIAFVRL